MTMTIKPTTQNTRLITLRFFDADDKVLRTFTRARVPWGVLKRAIRMANTLNEEAISEDDLDSMAALLVDAFGGVFEVADVDKYCAIEDVIKAITDIVNLATSTVPNPAPPGR